VDIPDPPTNMVYWRVTNGPEVVEQLRRKGVRSRTLTCEYARAYS
jgi:hypothetical protein